jgi:excisionase family DNA binding protein
MLSVAEVSEIIHVSPKLVRDWISDGLLPAFRLGSNTRLVRIRSQDLEAFIEQHIRNHDLRKPGVVESDLPETSSTS